MKTPIRILFASFLFSVANVTAEEKPAIIVLPAEFEFTSPPVADAENGILLFVKAFKVPTGEEMERYGDSLELLKSGRPLEDPRFLEEFRQTYELGKKWLKSPLFFPECNNESLPNIAPFSRLFQATEILARQGLREGDREASDQFLTDALRWSKLLRSAEPSMLECLVAYYGWRSTVGLLLEDWQVHDDQRKRLNAILRVIEANRIEVEELVAITKVEARWWVRQGGTRALTEAFPGDKSSDMLLNDRFKHLTGSDLLSLPYDPEDEANRYFKLISGQIRRLRQGTPAVTWPGNSRPVVDRTIEDYRKLPNGLGDLLFEQGKNSPIDQPWIQGLCRQRLLDACLIWLKRERDGLDVTADYFKELTDPISGEPLDIDFENRVIRCRGWDGKAAPLKPEKLTPGFHHEEDDYILVAPRWKERK
jgi:hypothetical protein